MANPFVRTALSISITAIAVVPANAAKPAASETIVMLRHGEKPDAGLGQLNCQGLNRAMALPGVLMTMFGKPDAIFAPDPGETKDDRGRPYNYIRPLATIEPTAIALGMPVDTSLGVSHIDALGAKLETPDYRASLAVVAWEHNELVKLARRLVSDNGGNPATVPDWDRNDFDSIYVIRITRGGGKATATFEHKQEGLNGEPTSCPAASPR